MTLLSFLLYTIFIHLLATGQTAALYEQSATNFQNFKYANALPNARSVSSNKALARNPGASAPNLARNLAITGNELSNVNRNTANSIVAGNIAKVNTNPNLRTANTFSQNIVSNLASANAAVSLDVNNLVNAANCGVPSNSFKIANPSRSRNIVSSIEPSQSSQYRLGSSYIPAQNLNFQTKSNIASYLANRNIANANRANLPNWNRNAATGSSSQSVYGPPGDQKYGINVQADALKITGNVSVTGKLPFYSAVSLNDRLLTKGAASVNYGCSG